MRLLDCWGGCHAVNELGSILVFRMKMLQSHFWHLHQTENHPLLRVSLLMLQLWLRCIVAGFLCDDVTEHLAACLTLALCIFVPWILTYLHHLRGISRSTWSSLARVQQLSSRQGAALLLARSLAGVAVCKVSARRFFMRSMSPCPSCSIQFHRLLQLFHNCKQKSTEKIRPRSHRRNVRFIEWLNYLQIHSLQPWEQAKMAAL